MKQTVSDVHMLTLRLAYNVTGFLFTDPLSWLVETPFHRTSVADMIPDKF